MDARNRRCMNLHPAPHVMSSSLQMCFAMTPLLRGTTWKRGIFSQGKLLLHEPSKTSPLQKVKHWKLNLEFPAACRMFLVHRPPFPNRLSRQFQFLHAPKQRQTSWCRGSEDRTDRRSSLTSGSKPYSPCVSSRRPSSAKQARRAQVGVTKMRVSQGRRFPVRAERSRCHEAVFNRISPSLLDIFHNSRAVSHFLDEVVGGIWRAQQWKVRTL